MKKMLIVGVSDTIGGIEKLFKDLFSTKSQIFQISFLCFSENCAFEEIYRNNGYTIYHLPPRGEHPFSFNKIVRNFYAEHNDFDYIWINTASTSMYQMQLYGKKYTKAKIITHSHGTKFENSSGIWKYFLNNFLDMINYRKVVENTDLFFCCSYAAGEALFGKKYREKLILIKNGVDVDRFKYDVKKRHEIRSEYLLNDDFTIGIIGRLSSPKNPIRAIQIFKAFNDREKHSKLIVVGDGPLREAVSCEVKKLGIMDKVIFTGYRDDVDRFYSAIDCLLMPSLFEGLPLSVIEAQTSGVPCLLSDKITKEVKILDSCHFENLNDNNKVWSDSIIKIKQNKVGDTLRDNAFISIINNGYTINQTRSFVEELLK